MKRAMLDTDILSEFLRGNQNVMAKMEKYVEEHSFATFSIITYYEILNGLLYKDAGKQLSKFEAFIELNNVIPCNCSNGKTSGHYTSRYARKGNCNRTYRHAYCRERNSQWLTTNNKQYGTF
ncbi:MAG: hypothetical protein QM610_01735 [Chitinophagaceae bacterium]